MVASPRQRLILPLAPTGAGVAGVLTALLFVALPAHMLDTLVVDSGIASLVNAAQPPLGFTARALLVLVGGGIATAIAWVALFVAVGTRAVVIHHPRAPRTAGREPRRADAHPDAPPRQPLFANRDLGAPFLDVRAESASTVAEPPVERALPTDLDMPLAAFDPRSFAAPPASAPEAPLPIRLDTDRAIDLIAASMSRTIAPRDTPAAEPDPETPMPIRLDTGHAIDLIAASMQQPPARPAPPESPDSIRALLDRLERSVARREATPQPASTREARQESIRDTLDTLRGLATRAG